MAGSLVIAVSLFYLGLLFAIAYFVEKSSERGLRLVQNPYIYTLSIAVFCTSWTFYGSVGQAATTGLDFLPIYIGPTLVFILWSSIWVKIIRICKINRITSIADFISSRYGKSTALGGVVTIIAVIGTTPYISLQLKSIATSFTILVDFSMDKVSSTSTQSAVFDTTFIVALVLSMFSILFGTRHIDASEQHQGLVAAVAFESLIKLFAFIAVGLFVTFSIHDGFADLFITASKSPELVHLFTVSHASGYEKWMTMTLLSMAAIICLPRQFYITSVANVDENHLRKATWLFPLYLFVINIFVLPIAITGKMTFAGQLADADMFVLTVPIFYDQKALALFAFIGGLSAATSMVIVAAIALSTMMCNNLIMPFLIRWRWVNLELPGDHSGLLLRIRRASIIFILIMGYGYYRLASESYSLVTIGLVSFAAVAQFAPAIIGGIFWKGATRSGALWGLILGFLIWLYTLLLPSFAQSGWLPLSFIEQGPFGIDLLRPYGLLGLDGMDKLTHALFWSVLFNITGYVLVSLSSRQSPIERIQSTLFVDVFEHTERLDKSRYLKTTINVKDLQDLAGRFVGIRKAKASFQAFASNRDIAFKDSEIADSALINYAENLLAGAVGSATARILIGSVVKGEIASLDEIYQVIDETSQVIEYSHQLETKSRELENTTLQLQMANERLKELDSLKDDFLSVVSHELRTPLTSIRAFGEILSDGSEIPESERQNFAGIIAKESGRLSRLIDQILDLAKMKSGKMEWSMADVDIKPIIDDSLAMMDGIFKEKGVQLHLDIPLKLPAVHADSDKFLQVMINLLSNAAKFCRHPNGVIEVRVEVKADCLQVSIADNGEGIPESDRELIFEKFQQLSDDTAYQARGTGLGLSICLQIVDIFGGDIWISDRLKGGAEFFFTVPYMSPENS